jgi:adenine phosphoribosyltransferase
VDAQAHPDAAALVQSLIIDVPDFPKPGILFKDLTPVFQNPEGYAVLIEAFASRYRALDVQAVVAIESRGFLIGAPLAQSLGLGLSLVRKHGKLPRKTFQARYALEYGEDHIEMHIDTVQPGMRVVLIDDLLATGGTAGAALKVLREAQAEVVEVAFAVELAALGGRSSLGVPVFSLLQF